MSSSGSDTDTSSDDELHVEVIQDTNGWATIYWWNQADEDKQVEIIVTDITAGTEKQFESQLDVTLFYLPMQLTNGEDYTVTVRGPTTQEEGEVTFRADDNQVTVEQSSRTTATVRWPAELGQHSDVEITLEEVTKENVTKNTFNWTAREQPFHVPHTLTMGQQYMVTVRGVDKGNLKTRFRAEFTRTESETLLRKAESFANGVVRYRPYNYVVSPCEVFYRNKTEEYFDDCYTKHNGTMNVYLKDNNGDPACIINGQISGLFFMTNIYLPTGKPRQWSPFGSKRLSVPAMTMFPTDANLYFADFYCTYKQHYVTLVLTKPDSNLDHFCQHKKLIKLDNRNNTFLNHRTRHDGEVYVEVTTKVMVEVFYTENVELPDRETLTTVPSSGTSTPGGLPKNPRCPNCNLPTDQDVVARLAQLYVN